MLQGEWGGKCLYWVKSSSSVVTGVSATDLFNNKHVFLCWLYFLCLFAPMKLHLLPGLKGPHVLPLQPSPPHFKYSSPAVTLAIKAYRSNSTAGMPSAPRTPSKFWSPSWDYTHSFLNHTAFFFNLSPPQLSPGSLPFVFIAKHQTLYNETESWVHH